MSVEPQARPARPRVRLLIFSITVDWRWLEEEVAKVADGRLCVLTPHWLFPHERKRLEAVGGKAFDYLTFHDLLDATAMVYCDEEADREVLAAHGRRDGLVADYFATIKRLKNQYAAERMQEQFEISDGAVLSGDLGIVPSVWLAMGLCDRIPTVKAPKVPLGVRLRRLLFDPIPCHYLRWSDQCWLLVGRPERVGQYLNAEKTSLRPAGRFLSAWIHLLMVAGLRLRLGSGILGPLFWISSIFRFVFNRTASQLAATVHEDNPILPILAEALAVDYVNLQDSFLPEHYPSRYLLYRPRVRRFFVWDQLSRGIFTRHGLESVIWSAYQSWTLPSIRPAAIGLVRRIVYLSSGAGDWTALKNRSDEDLALALLIEVARQRRDLMIHYRPHPLWLHPEHQGLNSIQRAIDCIAQSGLANIVVSQGAKVDARQFSISKNLSAVSSSVDEDIASADLVLGEHSQTMLVAARRGKVIAGVNVSRHPAFFGDYARLGFPLVTTASELIALIDRIGSDGSFWAEYNDVIHRHNRENCGVSSE